MLGVGGAIFYVPFFYGTGMELKSAITIALLLNIVTSSSAAIIYLRKNMVDLQVAIPVILFAAIGTPIGAYLSMLAPTNLILIIFSIQMIFIAVEMLFAGFEKFYRGKKLDDSSKKRLIICGAFTIGVLSGLLGLGGGSFIVPMLIVLGFGIKVSIATSGFIVVFVSAFAFFSHLWTWEPDIAFVVYVAAAAFIGAQIGSRMMHSRLKAETLRKVLGILLLVIAANILYGIF